MEGQEKRELLLEGLSCAQCSAKIEAETNALEGVTARMNFATQTLQLEYPRAKNGEDVVEKVRKIALAHEPDLHIREKSPRQETTETFILEGLGCANCAMKMEDRIGRLSGIGSVSIDFTTRKMKVTPLAGTLSRQTLEEMQGIIADLEPETKLLSEESSLDEKRQPEKDHSVRKDVLLILLSGFILLGASYVPMNETLKLGFFLLSYLLVGGEILLRAGRNLVRGQVFDENFLMSVATMGAFLVGEYPEGVAVMLFYQVGELFQHLAVERSRKSIGDLMDIRPDYANLLQGEEVRRVLPQEVRPGDLLMVKPGERIPLDGVILSGTSSADTSALTGESLPRDLAVGDEVLSGFINLQGVLRMKVEKPYGESTVTKILELVENAAGRKAPTENFITKFARYYTPAVVLSALAIAFLPPLLFPGALLSDWGYRALVFLVISCPCALVVSIPLSFFGGIGGASRQGILVKGSNYLEALAHLDQVVFDKTGTLTHGKFQVTQVVPAPHFSAEELLRIAAHVESQSNHPIAMSILKAYGQDVDPSKITAYEEIAGYGIRATLEEGEVLAGNHRFMVKESINMDDAKVLGTVVHISVNGQYAGHLVIADEVKKDSAEAITQLKALGIRKTVMLTGDRRSVGEKVGELLGLDEIHTELLPGDKVMALEKLMEKSTADTPVAFVGDGINDAPVLARSHVGIAMGGLGSDAAIEAADVVIMSDEPLKVATAVKIARRTRRIVWQNIAFALGVKGLFLLLGALGFATMWEAVFADVGVTVLAVLNAMRAMNTKGL